jgi:tRNA threonylcarbamoyladenosine biosynthesis protein TsaE
LRLRSRSPEDTRAAARRLGEAIDEEMPAGGGPVVVALVGPLGAGKTEWVKGLAEGLRVDPDQVASPTYVIASEYRAPAGRRLAHVDLYRVESEGELEATGFLDLLVPGMVVAVEWADRFPAALPADRIEVRIERGAEAETERGLELRATGPLAWKLLGAWTRRQASPGLARPCPPPAAGETRPDSAGE